MDTVGITARRVPRELAHRLSPAECSPDPRLARTRTPRHGVYPLTPSTGDSAATLHTRWSWRWRLCPAVAPRQPRHLLENPFGTKVHP